MNILQTVGYLLIALLGFGILILIHEFGHFILAKINGVIVEEFSIGMGPKLFGVKGKETQYNIRILPIGGYIKMLGENEESTNPRAFTNLPPARRLSIVAAGPIMNIILAIILFAIVRGAIGFSIPIVNVVEKNSPAAIVGLQPNDKLTSINNKKFANWDEFVTAVSSSKGNRIRVGYQRDGVEKIVNVTPIMDKTQGRYIIGISPKAQKYGILQSIGLGAKDTNTMVDETFKFFGTLFAGKAKASEVGGPVSIMKISVKAAELGMLNLTYLLAAISVQLGIFNIIPFPALDGGYIFLFIFEIITKKKVPDNKVGVINYIGFICLMGLMILVTIKDILYPLKF